MNFPDLLFQRSELLIDPGHHPFKLRLVEQGGLREPGAGNPEFDNVRIAGMDHVDDQFRHWFPGHFDAPEFRHFVGEHISP